MALLADTAHFIRTSTTTNNTCFPVMVTMTNVGIPCNILRLWTSWFPTMLEIAIPTATLQWKQQVPIHDEKEQVVLESQFVIVNSNKDSETSSGDRMVDMTTPVALYAIVRQNNGSSRIVWKKC